MEFQFLIFLLLFPAIFGDACVTYNFEEGFESFDPTLGTVCASVNNNWSLRQYNATSLSIDPPHPLSETFITSVATSSCVSSFLFDVESGGVVEVSVYMRFTEFMTIGIYNEAGQQVATWASSANPIPANQWVTVRLTAATASTQPVRGYLSLFAMVATDETILVDSFRYIPPNQDADDIECAIYTDEDNSNTESGTTENNDITNEPTTENGTTTAENDGITEAPTTENESSTTENNSITEGLTTENESSTTENNGLTQAPTTENESSTTENDDAPEASTTENYSETTENDGTAVTNGPDETTDSNGPGITTDNYTTDINSTEPNQGETTDIPDYEEAESSFWAPLTIALIATGSFLVLLLIIYVSYWCGKRKEKKKIPAILFLDIEELPKPIIVPRVKQVYTDSMRSSNPHAKDYF